MRNSLDMMRRERTWLVVLLLILLHHISATKDDQQHLCLPSSCGNITNITYPFRLQGDPENCGDERYELGCQNNVTVLYLNSAQYHVQAINYDNYTVRVVDPALQHHNCSSLPLRSLSRSNFSDTYTDSADLYITVLYLYLIVEYLSFEHIVFLNCNHSVRENGKYVKSGECVKWDSKGYAYAVGGDLKAEDLEVGCDVKLVAPTSFRTFNKHSYAAIHRALAYGFEISWINLACQNHCPNEFCYFNSSSQNFHCFHTGESGLWWLKQYAELPLEWLAACTVVFFHGNGGPLQRRQRRFTHGSGASPMAAAASSHGSGASPTAAALLPRQRHFSHSSGGVLPQQRRRPPTAAAASSHSSGDVLPWQRSRPPKGCGGVLPAAPVTVWEDGCTVEKNGGRR